MICLVKLGIWFQINATSFNWIWKKIEFDTLIFSLRNGSGVNICGHWLMNLIISHNSKNREKKLMLNTSFVTIYFGSWKTKKNIDIRLFEVMWATVLSKLSITVITE